ncbi:23S rRNA pseudouridylate synthase B [Acidihalobacter yilgarnensis]|uniref:Pseudouridine synthase n=1 Tax=Acidihalobacter yilgarnensis TaxID=2819280 RepID=A0A1D8IMC6_9GAMM|nr:pseudouridine synthase [Acidihalobacter yilgarnensis]AOU97619.1 23S rRNA pseudouridylate synthase B [Acidihalobacter yilgarnensis]
MNDSVPPERLQKLLARAGLGSRREIETWIAAGEITVNGEVATLGTRATASDRVTRQGRPLSLSRRIAQEPQTIVYFKPEGEVSTRSDPEGRPSVYANLPRGRWVGVGRLDINTSGLLLFTNDGELAHKLMHPSSGIEREYAVRIRGEASEEQLTRLRTGIELDDGPAGFDDVIDAGGSGGSNHWFHVVLKEGRKREVRRLWEAVGLVVSRLIRVRYGPIQLGRVLRAGRWRALDENELRELYKAAGVNPPFPTRPPKRTRPSRRR